MRLIRCLINTLVFLITNISVVASYMMWQVINKYKATLSDDFQKIIQEYIKTKRGVVEELPRWRQCLTVTGRAFGMPLGLLYINEKFSGESKEKVRELAFHIIFLLHYCLCLKCG